MSRSGASELATRLAPLVQETRCGIVEVLHSGAIAVANVEGKLSCYGDGEIIVPMRSTLKPFILGVLLDTVLKHESFSDSELALMSSSHNGQARHIAELERLLERFGISATELVCGVHPRFCDDSHMTPSANNCSGKHALFLIASMVAGWNRSDYTEPTSQIQRLVRDLLERDIFGGPILAGVDGCSIPNYAVSLGEIASTYARFGADMLGPGVARVRRAHLAEPDLIGGEDCLDTYLIREFGLAAKSGSDGVWAVGAPLQGLGFAVKAISGSEEAAQVALLECLYRLSSIPFGGDEILEKFGTRPRLSWAGRLVGEIETCFAGFPLTPKP